MADLYQVSTNTTGIDNILIDIVTEVPAFVPSFLLFVFFVVFAGGVALQKARRGSADYPVWSVIASMSILLLSLVMTLKEGLIRLEWLTIVVILVIFTGAWLFLDRRASEI